MPTTPNVQQWRCRKCRTSLAGFPHIRLGSALLGLTGLCLNCADHLAADMRAAGHLKGPEVRQFVEVYIASQKRESNTNGARIRSLEAEIADLRQLLEQVTRPDPGQKGTT